MLQALQRPAVLIWSFRDDLPAPALERCRDWLPTQRFYSPQGLPVYHAAPLLMERGGVPVPTLMPLASPEEQLVEAGVLVDGAPAVIGISPLDLGQPADLVDGDRETLVRGRDANPLVVVLRFDEPRQVAAVGLDLTTMPQVRISVEVRGEDRQVVTATRELTDLPPDPFVLVELPGGARSALLVRVAIEDLRPRPSEGYHVHLRELRLQ
jgi:hypothetical protein